jgi:Rrf2 family transcriptional regulator, cysteine metabolism repressor
MLFSAKAEYACLAMFELATRAGGERPSRLVDLAEQHGIPQRFLVQILLQLKAARLVESIRGAAGGYVLARAPEQVTLADVLAAVDPPDRGRRTGRNGKPIRSSGTITGGMTIIRGIWNDVDEAQKKVLESITLAELVSRAEQQNGLLYEI